METKSILVDFNYVEDSFNVEDLYSAYLEGRKDYEREIKAKIKNNLQTSALASSLFKEKLKEISIDVKDMYLRLLDIKDSECLVVIDDKDYYKKEKRWKSYKVSKEVNDGVDDINILFSFMPSSKEVRNDIITSEGFYFKYGRKKT